MVAVPALTSSSPLRLPRSIFFLYTATLSFLSLLHPRPVILLPISSPFFPLSFHHPCLSFGAEAAPVKLISLLCWGAPSRHRLCFPLTLSLWPSVFLCISLTVPSTFLSYPGALYPGFCLSSVLLSLFFCFSTSPSSSRTFILSLSQMHPQLFVSHSKGTPGIEKTSLQLHDPNTMPLQHMSVSAFECVCRGKTERGWGNVFLVWSQWDFVITCMRPLICVFQQCVNPMCGCFPMCCNMLYECFQGTHCRQGATVIGSMHMEVMVRKASPPNLF